VEEEEEEKCSMGIGAEFIAGVEQVQRPSVVRCLYVDKVLIWYKGPGQQDAFILTKC
jgi:hypothetical protein